MAEQEIIYLDNNATTQLDPAVVDEMLPFLTASYGNPSAGYKFGTEARKGIEQAREKEVTVAASGATGNSAIMPKIINRFLKTKFKVIGGYTEGSGVTLALDDPDPVERQCQGESADTGADDDDTARLVSHGRSVPGRWPAQSAGDP